MTNEEFHGMLMAALHGPHAIDIVTRVVEVAMDEIGKGSDGDAGLDAIISAIEGNNEERLTDLEIWAHLSEMPRLKPMDTMNSIAARGTVVDRIRERLRSQIDESESERVKEFGKAIMLDHTPKRPA